MLPMRLSTRKSWNRLYERDIGWMATLVRSSISAACAMIHAHILTGYSIGESGAFVPRPYLTDGRREPLEKLPDWPSTFGMVMVLWTRTMNMSLRLSCRMNCSAVNFRHTFLKRLDFVILNMLSKYNLNRDIFSIQW